MGPGVQLTKYTATKNGKAYEYWCLRWYDSRGQRRTRNLGATTGPRALSKRQAEIARAELEKELANCPQRRDATLAPKLGEFLDRYLAIRKTDLAPGTYELHVRTGKHLRTYFGAERRIAEIQKPNARDFKSALANHELKMRVNLAASTVAQHIRIAHTVFQMAVEDSILLVNPFDKLAEHKNYPKAWHMVTEYEFHRLNPPPAPIGRCSWPWHFGQGYGAGKPFMYGGNASTGPNAA